MDESKARERAFHDARFKQDIDPRHRLAKYYAVTGASNAFFREIVAERAGPNQDLLEYGCGTGGDFHFYKRLGCNVHGIDISGEAIAKAEAEALRHGLVAHYSVQDAEATHFADDSFDLIAGHGILHHLDLTRSLSELARITKTGGTCVFTEPLGHNPLINLFRRFTPALRTADEHPLVRADFGLMNRYFHDVSVKHFYLFTLLSVAVRRTRWFDGAYRQLLRLDGYLFKKFPRLGDHAWICIITLKNPRSSPLR